MKWKPGRPRDLNQRTNPKPLSTQEMKSRLVYSSTVPNMSAGRRGSPAPSHILRNQVRRWVGTRGRCLLNTLESVHIPALEDQHCKEVTVRSSRVRLGVAPSSTNACSCFETWFYHICLTVKPMLRRLRQEDLFLDR